MPLLDHDFDELRLRSDLDLFAVGTVTVEYDDDGFLDIDGVTVKRVVDGPTGNSFVAPKMLFAKLAEEAIRYDRERMQTLRESCFEALADDGVDVDRAA